MSTKQPKVSAAKVSIGTPDQSKLTLSQFAAAGILTNPGISIFGESLQFGVVRAGVTIGAPVAIPGVTLPNSLEVSGIQFYYGTLNIVGVSIFTGLMTVNGGSIHNGFTTKNGPDISNAFFLCNGRSIFNATSRFNAPILAGLVKADFFLAPAAAIKIVEGKCTGNKTTGAFDLPHWKDKGKRIRHLCAEGPEAGIYIRGRLKDSNVIELPEYWDGLVDYDTITVQLQPIGERHYHLNVMEIDKEKIVVKDSDDKPIDCFYHVWVARWIDPTNHDEKLHVVYDGESPADYPGNNANYLIGGWDYDRREPQWGNE